MAASSAATFALLALTPVTAAAEGGAVSRPPALEKYGWWNRAQQLPPDSGEVPPPPGAPAKGIYVAHDISSAGAAEEDGPDSPTPTPAPGTPLTPIPTPLLPPAPSGGARTASSTDAEPAPASSATPEPAAIGAVRFSVPPGARAVLTMQVEKGTTSGATIVACPVRSNWVAATNGRWDAKPSFACASSAKGRAQGADVMTFELPPSLQTQEGVFDLALVPRGSTPFEVGFKAPTDASLVVTQAAEAASGSKYQEPVVLGGTKETVEPGSRPLPAIRGGGFTLSPAAITVLSGDTSAPVMLAAPDPSQVELPAVELPAEEPAEPRVLGIVRDANQANAGPRFIAGGVVLLVLGIAMARVSRAARRESSPA